jgi:putative adenylate-forming enzyme
MLPTVDKAAMMTHFDSYTTRGVRYEPALNIALEAEQRRDFRPLLDGLTVGLSSGTSGHRGLFVLSATEQAAWAGTILARTLHGTISRGVRVAFFLRSNSNLYEQTGSFIRFRYFDLMMPLAEAIVALNQFQPTIVVGPPSLLALLATAQDRGASRIRPTRLISVAEVLEPEERAYIAATFGAPVHEIYQATEGLLAVSCAAGSLHVQEDIVRLQFEPLDGDEHGVAHWTPIITDLWRRTQPIIRYRLQDVLQLDDDPCACGSDWQVIKRIEGRRDDVCWFDTIGGGRRPFFPDSLRRAMLLASPAILDYRIVQHTDDTLRVHLSVPTEANAAKVIEAVRASLQATIATYGCRVPDIHIDTAFEPPPPGTKRRRVARLAC